MTGSAAPGARIAGKGGDRTAFRALRLATYNVAWFNALFDDDDRMRPDDARSGRHGITRAAQIEGLGRVFDALDADAVMVIEAPDEGNGRSCVAALEGFAAHFGLRARRALVGYVSESQQEIAVMFDPDRLSLLHDPAPGNAEVPRFDAEFRYADPSNGQSSTVRFARPPLELLCETVGGKVFRMIGVHTKSKAPAGARSPEDAERLKLENRRKQYGQCLWLRARITDYLAAGDPLVVLGDFNDGPEVDEFEDIFPQSAVELVLGWDLAPDLQLYDRHARMGLSKHLAAAPVSARFQLPDGPYISALLDYIMVSPDLRARNPRWRVWNPFDDPVCHGDPGLCAALLAASDHFPVTLDIDL